MNWLFRYYNHFLHSQTPDCQFHDQVFPVSLFNDKIKSMELIPDDVDEGAGGRITKINLNGRQQQQL